MQNDFFSLIIFLAFEVSILHDEKYEINIDELLLYRKELYKCISDYLKKFNQFTDKKYEKHAKKIIKSEMYITDEELIKYVKSFVSKNSDLFMIEGDKIIFTKRVSYTESISYRFKRNKFDDKFERLFAQNIIGFRDEVNCLDAIGVHIVKDEVNKMIELEQYIENAYYNLESDDAVNSIRIGNSMMLLILRKLFTSLEDKMRAYTRLFGDSKTSDDFDPHFLLSDYLVKNDKFFNFNSDVSYLICDQYQRAIFDNDDLSRDKLLLYADALWSSRVEDTNFKHNYEDDEDEEEREYEEDYDEEDENEDEDEIIDEFEDLDDSDDEEYEEDNEESIYEEFVHDSLIDLFFYLNYIKIINIYIQKYGEDEELNKSKSRLLYLLDVFGYNLYENDNLNTIISKVSLDSFKNPKADFYDFYVLSRCFLVDYLEGYIIDDINLLKKVMFASAYYDLTKDTRIDRLINKYKLSEEGKAVEQAIYNHDFSYFIQKNTSRKIKPN